MLAKSCMDNLLNINTICVHIKPSWATAVDRHHFQYAISSCTAAGLWWLKLGSTFTRGSCWSCFCWRRWPPSSLRSGWRHLSDSPCCDFRVIKEETYPKNRARSLQSTHTLRNCCWAVFIMFHETLFSGRNCPVNSAIVEANLHALSDHVHFPSEGGTSRRKWWHGKLHQKGLRNSMKVLTFAFSPLLK